MGGGYVKDDGRKKKESKRGREMFEMKAKEKRWRGGGVGGRRIREVRPTFGGRWVAGG